MPEGIKDAFHSTRAGWRLLAQTRSPLSVLSILGRPIRQARRSSMLSTARLLELYRLALLVNREQVAGDFVECGVYRGGSAAVLGYALRRSPVPRRLWLFDSFRGMPQPGQQDGEAARGLEGRWVGEQAGVIELLTETGVPAEQVRIVPGWFEQTFSTVEIDKVALLHIDADWYGSVKLCLERFYGVLARDAVVVLDDYHDWPGCRAALEEFGRDRGLLIELAQNGDGAPYFHTPAGGGG